MYLERLSVAGIDTSPYYQSKKFNKGKGTDSDMPNCTQYAVCRSYEATLSSMETKEPFSMFKGRSAGGYPMAKDFYNDSILPKGKELKVGSIACFDGTCGHVAFVERVIDSTHAVISESQYCSDKSIRDYRYWQTREVELIVGKATLSGVGALQGFIYLPVKDIRVSRDTDKVQIAVTEDMVNVRVKADGDVAVRGCYAPMGIYDVVDTAVTDYTWYSVGSDLWIREGEWIDYYPIEDNEIARLKEENRVLAKDKEILLNILAEIHEITGGYIQ